MVKCSKCGIDAADVKKDMEKLIKMLEDTMQQKDDKLAAWSTKLGEMLTEDGEIYHPEKNDD